MCGLVGYCTQKPSMVRQRRLLLPLVEQAKIRGLHAFGAAWWEEFDEYVDVRKYFQIEELLDFLGNNSFQDVITHARYSTSGNWQDINNNQPISVAGWHLAFNGVISMKTKEEMEEEWHTELSTDNDGEIFIRYMMRGADPAQFVQDIEGSFAGLWYNPAGELFAIRNERRPLWYFQTDGTVCFASTKDIIHRAVGEEYVNKAQECVPGQLYVLEDMI